MQIEQLKEAVKDASAVKTLIAEKFQDQEVQAYLADAYEASLKNSRSNHFLLSNDKLLNLRTVVGIHLAEELVAQMSDEDENKAYLTEIIGKAKTVLGVEDTAKALEDFLAQRQTEEAPVAEEEPKAEEPAPTAPVLDEQQLLDKISALLDEKLAGFTQVKDSQGINLTEELTALRATLDEDEKVISTLQENYKESLIELIKTKKGDLSEAYLEKLKARTVDELKLTLEDISEGVKEKEPEETLAPVTQEEAVAKVEDAQKEPEPTEEVPVEDQDTQQAFLARAKEVGFAKATLEFKYKG